MSEKESPLDFFSSTSRKNLKGAEVEETPKKTVLDRTSKKTASSSNDYKPSVSDSEAAMMLQKMKEMQRDLDEKIEAVSRKTGVPKNEVLNLIHKYQNLSKEDLARIEIEKKDFAAKVWQSIDRDVSVHSVPPPTKRKSKTLAMRKKWIPIN